MKVANICLKKKTKTKNKDSYDVGREDKLKIAKKMRKKQGLFRCWQGEEM